MKIFYSIMMNKEDRDLDRDLINYMKNLNQITIKLFFIVIIYYGKPYIII